MHRRGFIKNSFAAAIPLLMPFPFGEFLSDSQMDKNLVFIQLVGGNDGYNTLVPYTSNEYYLYRPSLAIPAKDVIRLTETHGLNPALSSLSSYYKRNEIAFINYVGSANEEPSHYTAAEIWNSAFPLREVETNDLDFKDQLSGIASAIDKGENGIYSAALDGFDTHQFQRNKHDSLLKEYADCLDYFIIQLKQQDTFNNTLIITWSEFGRSLQQNNRKGTDHGNANVVIIAGGGLRQTGVLNGIQNQLLSASEVSKLLMENAFT